MNEVDGDREQRRVEECSFENVSCLFVDTTTLGQSALKTSHYNQVECNLVNGIKPQSRWRLIYWRENAINETTDAYVMMVMQRTASSCNETSVACKVSPLSRSILLAKCLHQARSCTSIVTSLASNRYVCGHITQRTLFFSSEF